MIIAQNIWKGTKEGHQENKYQKGGPWLKNSNQEKGPGNNKYYGDYKIINLDKRCGPEKIKKQV